MISLSVFVIFSVFAAFSVCAVMLAFSFGVNYARSVYEKKEIRPLFNSKKKEKKSFSDLDLKQKEEAEFVDGYEG